MGSVSALSTFFVCSHGGVCRYQPLWRRWSAEPSHHDTHITFLTSNLSCVFELLQGSTYPCWLLTTLTPSSLKSVVWCVCPKTQTFTPSRICDKISVPKATLQGSWECCGFDVLWSKGAWCVTTRIDVILPHFSAFPFSWCIKCISFCSQARSELWLALWSLTD